MRNGTGGRRMMEKEVMLSPAEASYLCGGRPSESTIRRWCHNAMITCHIMPSGTILIPHSKFKEFMKEHQIDQKKTPSKSVKPVKPSRPVTM